MSALVQIVIKPQQQEDLEFIYRLGLQKAKLNPDEVIDWRIRKRSLDARKAAIKMNVQLEFWKVGEVREPTQAWTAKTVDPEKKIAIIGAGPAGLYAALRAIEAGITPVVFERGKDVRARRRDLAAINKAQTVNPESNYCFGEGGAGTYSDGKLYTRSKKRGNVLKALEWLVHFGASDDILVEAHPHIGTNKLPAIITAMREAVIAYGGAVHFNAKLTDIKIENNSIK
ncbi:MAG: FAD-binding protein, partial [Flavobacteriaceae bacterium]